MNNFANGKTVHIREHQIEQNHVRQRGAGHVKGLHAVRCCENFASLPFQIELQKLDKLRRYWLWMMTRSLSSFCRSKLNSRSWTNSWSSSTTNTFGFMRR